MIFYSSAGKLSAADRCSKIAYAAPAATVKVRGKLCSAKIFLQLLAFQLDLQLEELAIA